MSAHEGSKWPHRDIAPMIAIQAAPRMVALALGLDPRDWQSLSEVERESLLLSHLYGRFPNYAPDADDNDRAGVSWSIYRGRRYQLVVGGIGLGHSLKTVYSPETYEALTWRDSPLLALLRKRKRRKT